MIDLLVDIGNQNVKWVAGDRAGFFRSNHTSIAQQFNEHWGTLKTIDRVVFVNVADNECAKQLDNFVKSKWSSATVVEISSTEYLCGVTNAYQRTSELGADRWAAAIGAYSIYKQATVIVDCGSAITVDALAPNGRFVGGSILAGFRMAQQALSQKAAGIANFDDLKPQVPGRTTAQAVSSGVIIGTTGGVDRLISQYCDLVGNDCRLLLTGGDANIVKQHSTHRFKHIPNLVLIGLKAIAKTL